MNKLNPNQKHNPDLYVGGIYIPSIKEWRGEFVATSDELMMYAISPKTSAEETKLIQLLLNSQIAYSNWWNSVKISL